jgi:hypothetical protein
MCEFILEVGDLFLYGLAAILFFSVDLLLYFLPALVEQLDFGRGRAEFVVTHNSSKSNEMDCM